MLYLANLNTCRLYKTLCSSGLPLAYILFLFFDIYLFIYLAVSGLSCSIQNLHCITRDLFLPFFLFTYFNWRLTTLQYCSGFCHTLTWISHGCTCVPHPEPPSPFPPHPIPLGHPSAPAPSTLSHASCGTFRCGAQTLVATLGPSSCDIHGLWSAWAQELQGQAHLHSIWDPSFPTRDQTNVPCTGRWIFNHWTTREVPALFKSMYLYPRVTGEAGSIPGLGTCPGEGNDNSLQYSCLENHMDRVA